MGSITLKQVTKSFGDVDVIKPIDLQIEHGEFVVFVGPSGCGKSTLLRLIAGLEDVTSGAILIDGKDATDIPPAKRGLAMVFQSYALYPHRTGASNLNAALRVGMRLEISELHKRLETTMIYVTHDQVEAMTMADKIVVLRAGHIEQVGSPLELYRTPRNLFVAGFIGSPKMNLIAGNEAGKHGAHKIGVRPEHIAVSSGKGVWSGVVGVSEHLGSDTFFHIHETGLADTITVRSGGEVDFRHGDKINLTPRDDVIHKFGADGLRIA